MAGKHRRTWLDYLIEPWMIVFLLAVLAIVLTAIFFPQVYELIP